MNRVPFENVHTRFVVASLHLTHGVDFMTDIAPSGVIVIALTHDLARKRSLVTMVWDADPEKKVGLPVPFGCSLADVHSEAEKALRGLSAEIATICVSTPR